MGAAAIPGPGETESLCGDFTARKLSCREGEIRVGRFSGAGPLAGLALPWMVDADHAEAQTRTSLLHLSLMLLVLAFFIVLYSISVVDAQKAAGVMGGVASAFVDDIDPRPVSEPQGVDGETLLRGGDLKRNLEALLATELAIARLRHISPGRALEIEAPVAAFFPGGESRLRAARWALLRGMVAAVNGGLPAQPVSVTVLVGSEAAQGERSASLTTVPSALAIARAAALGDVLVGLGLPRSRLALGLRPNLGDRVRFSFDIALADTLAAAGSAQRSAAGDSQETSDRPYSDGTIRP